MKWSRERSREGEVPTVPLFEVDSGLDLRLARRKQLCRVPGAWCPLRGLVWELREGSTKPPILSHWPSDHRPVRLTPPCCGAGPEALLPHGHVVAGGSEPFPLQR